MEKRLIQFYKKYSEIILPIVFVIAAGVIFFQVSYPNVYTIISLQQEVSAEQAKLDTYKSSYSVLNNLNEQRLDRDVLLATDALPSVKDPGSIYLAVVAATTDAGGSLNGFSVQVGDILGKEIVTSGVPQKILVNVTVSDMDQDGFKIFTNALIGELPISTISEAKISNGEGDIDLNFYYMPYNLEFINTEIIKPLTQSEQKILSEIN